MDESRFLLNEANVAIIGLGLMGGSLALSLKGECHHLSALDNHLPTLTLARNEAIVDLASNDPAEVLRDADLVVLACPISAIFSWLERLPDYIQHPCIVLDLGSSKATVVSALEALPKNFDPLGGHPICGKETLSLLNADISLYRDAPFVFTPLLRTSDRARSAAVQMSEILGAQPVWLDAEAHDRILASTSHLPYLLSSALVLAIPEDAEPLIGPGFRSSTRLAGTASSMMLSVLTSNRDNILSALDSLKSQISEIETILQDDDPTILKSILDHANTRYRSLI